MRSRGNVVWVSFAMLIGASHAFIHHLNPAFVPPASSDKSPGVRVGIYGELIWHIAVFGAVLTSIRNRIPWQKKPSYSDDGILTIDSAQILPHPENRLAEIGFIVLEFALYLLLWTWIYRII